MRRIRLIFHSFCHQSKGSISALLSVLLPVTMIIIFGANSISTEYSARRKANDTLTLLCEGALGYFTKNSEAKAEQFLNSEVTTQDRIFLKKISDKSGFLNPYSNVYDENGRIVVNLQVKYPQPFSDFLSLSDSSPNEVNYNKECVLDPVVKKRILLLDFEKYKTRLARKGYFAFIFDSYGAEKQRAGLQDWHLDYNIELQNSRFTATPDGVIYAELDTSRIRTRGRYFTKTNSELAKDLTLQKGDYILQFYYYARGTHRYTNDIKVYLNQYPETGPPAIRSLISVHTRYNGGVPRKKWLHIVKNFEAKSNGRHRLRFLAGGYSDGVGGLIDKIELFHVENPGGKGFVIREGGKKTPTDSSAPSNSDGKSVPSNSNGSENDSEKQSNSIDITAPSNSNEIPEIEPTLELPQREPTISILQRK